MRVEDRPTKRKLPKRAKAVRAVLIHTTGDAKLEAILRYYTSEDGLQPHYCIGLDGLIYRIADESLIAYHAAIKSAEMFAYQAGFAYWSKKRWEENRNEPLAYNGLFPGYATWIQTWRPMHESPLDLVTGGSPNGVSVGIELQQPTDKESTADIFTDAQYQACAELVADVCGRHLISIDRGHVLGHQDVSPLRRCSGKGGWDPGDGFAWQRLLNDARALVYSRVG